MSTQGPAGLTKLTSIRPASSSFSRSPGECQVGAVSAVAPCSLCMVADPEIRRSVLGGGGTFEKQLSRQPAPDGYPFIPFGPISCICYWDPAALYHIND